MRITLENLYNYNLLGKIYRDVKIKGEAEFPKIWNRAHAILSNEKGKQNRNYHKISGIWGGTITWKGPVMSRVHGANPSLLGDIQKVLLLPLSPGISNIFRNGKVHLVFINWKVW